MDSNDEMTEHGERWRKEKDRDKLDKKCEILFCFVLFLVL